MTRAEGQEVFDDLAGAYLARTDVTRKQMFGSQALCLDDKIVGFVGTEGEMIVKLPAGRVDGLVTAGLGERVVIGRNPAREWVGIALDAREQWDDLLAESFAYLGSG